MTETKRSVADEVLTASTMGGQPRTRRSMQARAMWVCVVAAVLAAVELTAAPSRAQEPTLAPRAHAEPLVAQAPSAAPVLESPPKGRPDDRVSLDVGFIGGDSWLVGYTEDSGPIHGTLAVISTVARGRVLLADQFLIQAALPFAAAFEPGSTFRVGNPAASASYLWRLPRGLWMSAGIGLTAPLASIPRTSVEQLSRPSRALDVAVTYDSALAMRGWSNSWEFTADRFSVYLPYQIGIQLSTVRLAGQIVYAHGFGIGRLAQAYDRNLFELGVAGHWDAGRVVSVGLRARTIIDFTTGVYERVITSLEPLIEFNADPVQIELGVLFNFDDMFVDLRGRYFWAPRLGAAWRF